MGVWHIAEEEAFFLEQVPLQRSITHAHKRLQHLAGRLLLKELFPSFPVTLIRVADTRKPFLPDEPYHFSISHCGDYAAAIVSTDHRVGVDIELVDEKIRRLTGKFTGPAEQVLLTAGSFTDTATLIWSIKESVFKWHSIGGVDFSEDIRIQELRGDATEGHARVLFRGDTQLEVHYLHFNNNYLTWVLTNA